MDTELKIVGAKVGSVAGMVTWYGFTPNDVVTMLTILFLALQIGLLVPKYWRLAKELISRRRK